MPITYPDSLRQIVPTKDIYGPDAMELQLMQSFADARNGDTGSLAPFIARARQERFMRDQAMQEQIGRANQTNAGLAQDLMNRQERDSMEGRAAGLAKDSGVPLSVLAPLSRYFYRGSEQAIDDLDATNRAQRQAGVVKTLGEAANQEAQGLEHSYNAGRMPLPGPFTNVMGRIMREVDPSGLARERVQQAGALDVAKVQAAGRLEPRTSIQTDPFDGTVKEVTSGGVPQMAALKASQGLPGSTGGALAQTGLSKQQMLTANLSATADINKRWPNATVRSVRVDGDTVQVEITTSDGRKAQARYKVRKDGTHQWIE